MARRSWNIFSILSVDSEAEGEEEEEASAAARAETVERDIMRSDKKKPSRKARIKKDKNVESVLAKLCIHDEAADDDGKEEEEIPSPPLLPLPTQRIVPAIAPCFPEKKGGGDAKLLKWPLVWIDLEMTGLDLEKDRILEIACMITDGKLQELVEGPDLIINQSEELLGSMGDWCQTQHRASGLIEGVRRSNLTEKEAEQEVLNFVRLHIEDGAKQPLLAGNSVYVDLLFLRKYMPDLAAVFSHVVVDVSSIQALCFRWFPNDAKRAPTKKKAHRALEDIKESIAELTYMQKTIFKAHKK